MLLNVGFAEAMIDFNYTCVIFHDIDLLLMVVILQLLSIIVRLVFVEPQVSVPG